jgi:hypothetical protein
MTRWQQQDLKPLANRQRKLVLKLTDEQGLPGVRQNSSLEGVVPEKIRASSPRPSPPLRGGEGVFSFPTYGLSAPNGKTREEFCLTPETNLLGVELAACAPGTFCYVEK